MSLNIRNCETCSLAKELARLIGETITDTITVALRERLQCEQLHRSMGVRAGELRAIAERCAKLMGPGLPSVEHGDMLHDDQGQPK